MVWVKRLDQGRTGVVYYALSLNSLNHMQNHIGSFTIDITVQVCRQSCSSCFFAKKGMVHFVTILFLLRRNSYKSKLRVVRIVESDSRQTMAAPQTKTDGAFPSQRSCKSYNHLQALQYLHKGVRIVACLLGKCLFGHKILPVKLRKMVRSVGFCQFAKPRL